MPDHKTKSLPGKTLNVDLDARTVTHYVTCPTLDEDGEVLLPRGADISRFSKASTVFDVHEYGSQSVVGSTLQGSWKVTDDGIIATTKFAPRPPANLWPESEAWEPDRLLWLYHTGDLKGWSIGFAPLEGRRPTKQDRERWGDGLKYVHTRYRVLEYSVAPLPCNGDALTLVQRGMMSPRLAKALATGTRPAKGTWDIKVKPKRIVRRKVVLCLPPPPEVIAARKAQRERESQQAKLLSLVTAKQLGRLYAD